MKVTEISRQINELKAVNTHDHALVHHLLPFLRGVSLVDPAGIAPVLFRNLRCMERTSALVVEQCHLCRRGKSPPKMTSLRVIFRTPSLNASSNGSSFKKTQG